MQGGWWWAHSHPKHVKKRNRHTTKNCAPSWLYLQDIYSIFMRPIDCKWYWFYTRYHLTTDKPYHNAVHAHFTYFKLFVPCIFSTYGMKTNWCHYFIRILLDLYMFRAHGPIFRRVRTVVHTTTGSVSVPLCSRTEWHRYWTNGCVNSCTNSPEDGPVDPKHVEIQQYMNKIVTSVGFHSISFYVFYHLQSTSHIITLYTLRILLLTQNNYGW